MHVLRLGLYQSRKEAAKQSGRIDLEPRKILV